MENQEKEVKYQHFERPTSQRPPSIFNISLWAAFIGLVAGFGGYLLANYFLPGSSVSYLNINNQPRDIKVSIEQPLVSIANKYQKSIAGVYKEIRANTVVGEPLFSQEDFLGSAVVVTSDGWLLTTDQVAADDQALVVLGDSIYEIKEIKIDDFSGAVFVKIDENFLQPVNFQLTENLNIGETVFTDLDLANSYNHGFQVAYLSNPHYIANKYLNTDAIDYYIKISGSAETFSAPYFNMDGDLVGVSYSINDENLLIPSEYIKQAIKHLLNDTDRVALGLRYVDMENNAGFDRRGVLIYNPQFAAVTYNSPAYLAGIKTGDQIVAVNNDVISTARTFTSILQNYRPGDKIILKVLRDDQELDIEISL